MGVTWVHTETGRSVGLSCTSFIPVDGDTSPGELAEPVTSPGQESTIPTWQLEREEGNEGSGTQMWSLRHKWAEALNSFNAFIPSVLFLIQG